METRHDIHIGNAQDMSDLEDNSVELVVTSPPYPMIELWDDTFSTLNPEIDECLSDANSDRAFDLMHTELDQVWDEAQRVLAPGGIACINIGDATRSVNGTFQVFPNHARIVEAFRERGCTMLPGVLWRKPTNKAAKFMGSGMTPPNAYVTLEHEHILVFRNGDEPRAFESNSGRRYESAYFWEERNQWYSDVWDDIPGERQAVAADDARERSAAYPFTVPYRLVAMYSVQGDTVLDPFWGSGTTTLAAMAQARSSIGYELDDAFRDVFDQRAEHIPELTQKTNRERLIAHKNFVATYEDGASYSAEHYDTRVVTQQEQRIKFYDIDEVMQDDDGYTVEHTQFSGIDSGEKEKRRKKENVGAAEL